MSSILSKRVRTALYQESKNNEQEDDIQEVYTKLEKILGLCGEASTTRKMATRLGSSILQGHSKVIVPSCPDYGQKNGMYTFDGLGSGVSLLTQKHVVFLCKLQEVFPQLQPVLLIADLESDNLALCEAVGVSQDEFIHRLGKTLVATRELVSKYGWSVCNMTDLISDLRVKEVKAHQWISSRDDFVSRISVDTLSRVSMYQKVNARFTMDEMRARTIRTAAQYVALGEYAATNDALVCNHTTVNLSWYLQTDVALVHNPISVY